MTMRGRGTSTCPELEGQLLAVPLFSRASGFGSLFAIFEAEQGADALRRLRRESGFRVSDYAPSMLVPFSLMNRVYNLAAKMSGDAELGARVGRNFRLEEFGPFLEYALYDETLGDVIARSINAQPLHSNQLIMDLRVVGGQARWRLRYQTNAEPTVEHHAQMCLMQALGAVRRCTGAQIEIHVAEPYAAEARLLESRLDVRVRARTNDYELAFPAHWLWKWMPIAGLPPDLAVEALAPYRDRPLPRAMAEAVLIALELHGDQPIGGIGVIGAQIGLPPRTLQLALRSEGVSYRDIGRGLRLRRARQLLATTEKPLAEVALRTGYADPSNFHRAFLAQTGMTPGRFRATSRPQAPYRSEHR